LLQLRLTSLLENQPKKIVPASDVRKIIIKGRERAFRSRENLPDLLKKSGKKLR
jgi:hypothetical protein